MDEQMDKLLENLKESAVCEIGSRVWGGFNNNSDYDLVFSGNDCEKLLGYLEAKDIAYSSNKGASSEDNPGNDKMYNDYNIKFFTPDSNVINIIGYNNETDLIRISEANEYMKTICNTPLGINIRKDKQYRIQMFQAIMKNLFDEYSRPEHFEICNFDEDEMPF